MEAPRKVIFLGKEYDNILDLLQYMTYTWDDKIRALSEKNFRKFCDLLLEHMHMTPSFEFTGDEKPEPFSWLQSMTAFNKTPILTVATDLLARLMFVDTTPIARSGQLTRLFALLIISGVPVSAKTMCCAAALEHTKARFSETKRASWLETLIEMKIPLLDKEGQLITDPDTNMNILDIAESENIPHILNALANQKATGVHISLNMYNCIHMMTAYSPKVFIVV